MDFEKNRGTAEGIYTIKWIQHITDRKKQRLFLLFVDLSAAFDRKQRLFLLFVDLSAAFDRFPRDWLFESIRLRFDQNQSSPLFDILDSNTTL